MKTRCECFFLIDNSNIIVITIVLKTDHTSEKLGTNNSRKEYFFKIQAADNDLCSLLSRNPRNDYSLLLGLSRDKSLKRFLVSVDLLEASGVLADRDILVRHCVPWATFYIFSCKYKSSKPSIVKYIYQVKDNFLIEKNFNY